MAITTISAPGAVSNWYEPTVPLTAAMAALGIDSQLKRIGRAGLKSLVLGGVLFLHLVLTGGLANWLLA